MKGIIIAAIVCSLYAAVCMAYPASDSEATAQWHVNVPAFGCAEVRHYLGGQWFRVYVCDHLRGTCIFPNNVQACPLTAAVINAKPSLQRVVNVRGREHLVRFYQSGFGAACYVSALQTCVAQEEVEVQKDDEECRSVKLPTGEVLYDPMDCAPKTGVKVQADDMDEECRSLKLPTGEILYDPLDCGKSKPEEEQETSQKNMLDALMKLLVEN